MTYEAPKNGFRTFLIVLATQAVSVFGSLMTYFAITVWLTTVLYAAPEQKPQLAAALSIVSLAFAVPAIVIAPIAGAWADRHDRKRTMIVMNWASGFASLTLAAVMLSDHMQFWMLPVLTVVSSVCAQFHNSALDTSVAMIVPEKLLPRANGMLHTIFALTNVLAPMAAAGLIAIPALLRGGQATGLVGRTLAQLSSGAPLAIIIDGVTFFIAAVALVFLTVPSPKRTDLHGADERTKKTIWADVKEGTLYIWHRKPLLWLLATFAVLNFCGGPMGVFFPLILKFQLAADWLRRGLSFETAMAMMSTIMGVGGVTGGIIISTWGGLKKRRVFGILVPALVSSALLVAFGLSRNYIFSAIGGAVFAATGPFTNAHSQAIWQTQTPRELQGRVFAVRRVIAQCTAPLATAFAGWAAAAFEPGRVVAVLGTVAVVFMAVQMLNPFLMRVEDKEWLDRTAAASVAAAKEAAANVAE